MKMDDLKGCNLIPNTINLAEFCICGNPTDLVFVYKLKN